MTALFLSIFDFFESRRPLLFGLTFTSIVVMVLLATRVEFDEKITDIFPKTEEGQNMSMVFDNLKSKDRIIVLFTARDPEVGKDELIEACDSFAEQLDRPEIMEHIETLTSGVGSDEIARTTEFIFDHLPVFLDEQDYRRIDSLMEHRCIGRIMERNYQRMLSPMSIGLSGFIARDPLSIAGRTLGELQNFNPSLSYTLSDDHIFSSDMSTCLMIIKSEYPSNDTAGNEPLIEALDRLIRDTRIEGVEISYFGTPGIAVYNARQIKNDIYITLTLALLVVVVIITLSFYNRWAVLLITLPVLFGGLFALSIIALTTGHISLIAVGAGAAVFGIAISYSTHVVCHANHTRNGREIVEELAYPMTVGSITTIGAFLGLMFTSSPLLYDFGLFAALVLVGTPLFSLVCLPHLLECGNGKANRLLHFIERCNAYPFERNKWIVGGIVILFLVGALTYKRVGFATDMSNLSYIPEQIARAEERLSELFDVDNRSITIVASGEDVEQSVQRYTEMCQSLNRHLEEGKIRSVVSAERFIVAPSLQQEKIARWEEFWNTDNRRNRLREMVETEGRRVGFAQGAFSEFGYLLNHTYHPIDYSDREAASNPLLEAWISSSDHTTLVMAQFRIDEERKQEVYHDLSQMPGVVTIDRGYFANKMAQTVSDDFNYVLYMSGLLVFVALLVTYRRLELTLMTFAPMFIAFTIILGLMALLGLEFNIVNIILSTFIFGIGDDFSIFIMDGLQREYSDGRPMLSNHKTAIFFSVLTTIIGIGALCFAAHPVLRSTSVISIIGMLAVIISAYTILPLLFRWIITRPVSRGGQPYTLMSILRTLYGFNLFLLMCTAAQIVIPTLVFLPVSGRCKRRWMHTAISKSCRVLLWMTSLTEHKKVINPHGEKFARPAVIIANHHSFIDIVLLLSLSPRLVMVTNSWVWRSSVFGRIIRYLGFCCVDSGYEEVTDHVRKTFEEGYSVVIFPEGTRSRDGRTMGRFHKGAFYLAEQLGADIIPVLIYGTGMICSKRQPFYIRKGNYGVKILDRITACDTSWGEGYRARTKAISRAFKSAYEEWCSEEDTMDNPYFRESLVKNYTYKTNRAEISAYLRLRRARNFESLTRGIGRDARVVVFGAGQGELPLLLTLLSPRRKVVAFEQDGEKIDRARLSRLNNPNIEFVQTDYQQVEIPRADCYLFTSLLDSQTAARLAAQCEGEVRHE